MYSKNAWWKLCHAHGHWALFFLVALSCVFLANCTSSSQSNSSSNADDDMCLVERHLDLDEEFYKASARCHGNPSHSQTPILYAHFLGQTSPQEMCSEDLIEESNGAINCAPGPVSLDHGNSIDSNERDWILQSLPDYFAWHLSDKSSVDEMIYLANATGLPIKSQSIKLENEHNSTLVLFPKTTLLPGTKYYLYLVRTTKDATQKWIQPIVTTAKIATP